MQQRSTVRELLDGFALGIAIGCVGALLAWFAIGRADAGGELRPVRADDPLLAPVVHVAADHPAAATRPDTAGLDDPDALPAVRPAVCAAAGGAGRTRPGFAALRRSERGETDGDRRLLDAIRSVESRGHGDLAVGDGGRAAGPYQIWRSFWRDGCAQIGVAWDYRQLVWRRAHSEAVIRGVWRRYGATTDEAKARLMRGPNLANTADGDRYWARVKRELGK